MNIHSRARTCRASRGLLCRRVIDEGWKVTEAAYAAGISERTAYKWLARWRAEGPTGLGDRSSRPNIQPRRTPEERVGLVLRLRRQRMTSRAIGNRLRMPRSTVARIAQRAGLGKLRFLDPKEPIVRYERESPGDLLHLDIKKLARIVRGPGHRITGDRSTRVYGAGWEFVHVCIDDHSRLAYVEVLDDEKGLTARGFLKRALAWYKNQGISVRHLMTDNGSCYRSGVFEDVLQKAGIRHIFTRPYTPKTNGKAERFIGTLVREWAYVRPYNSSKLRTAQLSRWLRHYNHHRPHGGIGGHPPASRIGRATLRFPPLPRAIP